jgi:tRNA pseudouridine38-40 synthase
VLPQDVAILEIGLAEPDWHPRFSARRRSYRYTVLNRPVRSPLARRYACLVTEPLDLMALRAAAALLVGEHDFASFGRPTQGESTVRVVYAADWQQDGAWFSFDITGNGFLRGMVRSIVAALLQVGAGRWPVVRVSEVLAGRDRSLAAAPAPACGLCLMKVEYA